MPVSGFSWGEQVAIRLSYDGAVTVRSRCQGIMFQIFDWGKNKRNVDSFFDLLMARGPRVSLMSSLNETPHFDKEGKTPLQRAISNEESK